MPSTESSPIEAADPRMFALIGGEDRRQATTLMMIPSENYASAAVRLALATSLGNKYSEGYPNRRYYQGQEFTDQVESLTQERAKGLFGVPYVNVQPLSGAPANFAVYTALLNPGDRIMGLNLAAGGHLTHGAEASASSRYFRADQYNVRRDNSLVDYEELDEMAQRAHPAIIVAGTSAYPRVLDWERFSRIANDSGALLMADMAHFSGLVAGEAYPSPVPYVDVVTTTTHKTLRGPRGAMIMVTEKGLARDKDMGAKIDKAIFPGLQGGPHINTIAGIGVALHEAASDSFKVYSKDIVHNARVLATALAIEGFNLITGGTDSHLLLADLRKIGLSGKTAAEGLELAGIVANSNSIPFDSAPPFYPSGLRMGTPAVTSRGMGEEEMRQIGKMVGRVVGSMANSKEALGLTSGDERKIASRKAIFEASSEIPLVREEVLALCERFPIKEAY